jgi:hypothetical protein
MTEGRRLPNPNTIRLLASLTGVWGHAHSFTGTPRISHVLEMGMNIFLTLLAALPLSAIVVESDPSPGGAFASLVVRL